MFVAPGAAVVIGLIAGMVMIGGHYIVERKWGLNDQAGLVAACGMAGAWGLLALGIFADGAFGAGWNGVAVDQGLRGLLASDPGQLTAQIAALTALGAYAVVLSAILLTPLALITRRSIRPAATYDVTP
jgi:Amt family ammonium transporter